MKRSTLSTYSFIPQYYNNRKCLANNIIHKFIEAAQLNNKTSNSKLYLCQRKSGKSSLEETFTLWVAFYTFFFERREQIVGKNWTLDVDLNLK